MMALTTSVVINGMDVRAHFGFEVLRILKNVSLRRREVEFPHRHGIHTQGGTYEEAKLRLLGYMTTASKDTMLRALRSDTRYPSLSRSLGYVQLADDNGASRYYFDTLDEFDPTDQAGPRRLNPEVNVAVEFTITHVDAIDVAPSAYGTSETPVYSTFRQAATSQPEFAFLLENGSRYGSSYRDALLRIFGPCTNPRIASAEHGITHGFDGTLTAKGTLGTDVTAVLYGLQTANLLTDGDMEAAGTSAWSGGAVAKRGHTDSLARIMFGTQALRLAAGGGGGAEVYEDVSVSAQEYLFRAWVFREAGAAGITANIGPTGGPAVAEQTGLGTEGKWDLVEFVAPSTGATTWRPKIASTQANDVILIDDWVVCPSLLANGSFEDAWTGDNPTGWVATDVTEAQITGGSQRTGTYSYGVTFDAGTLSNMLIRHAITGGVTADKIYHFTAWVKKTAGTGLLRVVDNTDLTTLNASFDVGEDWTRISGHFKATGTGAASIMFQTTVADTAFVFDDLSVVELAAKAAGDSYFFEPGVYGRRLQVQTGECVVISDPVNRLGNTVVAHGLPLFGGGNGFGSALLWTAAKDNGALFSCLWDEAAGAFAFQRGVGSAGSAAPSTVRILGDAITVTPLAGSTSRGVIGVACRYSDGSLLPTADRGMRLYVERPNASGHPFEQAAESDTSTDTTACDRTPDTIILGDAFIWDAFWVYQFPQENVLRNLVSPVVPVNRNRLLTYAGTLTAGDSLEIDLSRYKIEKWDHDADPKLLNAFTNITGDLPEFFECPVLYSDVDIPGIQASLRIGGAG